MKVGKLIKQLQEFDPEMDILATDNHDDGDSKDPRMYEVASPEEAGGPDEEPFVVLWLDPHRP